MKFPTELSVEAHDALVAVIRIAAARGRALRFEREKAEKENYTDGLQDECISNEPKCATFVNERGQKPRAKQNTEDQAEP